MQAMIIECRAGTSVRAIKGDWQQKGTDNVWSIHETGLVLLDGEACGPDYDLSERGDGMLLTISRRDGWKVDIERSTDRVLWWYKQGEEDLQWLRSRPPEGAPGGDLVRAMSSKSSGQASGRSS